MIYNGIDLSLPKGKVTFTHSAPMALIQRRASDENTKWTDRLGTLPWGDLKQACPDRFKEASNIFSLLNMGYQVCNGGIRQYFDNGYDEERDPYSEHDVVQLDIREQQAFFAEIVPFANVIFPDRAEENLALKQASDAFQEVYCEDMIYGGSVFESVFYKTNAYLEELLEIRAQLCCKTLAREAVKHFPAQDGVMEALKEILPESAFRKPTLTDQVHSAESRAGSAAAAVPAPVMEPPTTNKT